MPTRPCWVEISTRAFEDNYRFLAGLAAPHAELLAIVKADAYGHSLAFCAPAAVRAGVGGWASPALKRVWPRGRCVPSRAFCSSAVFFRGRAGR